MADTFSFPTDRFILIGKIGKPHGLRGEVRLHHFSEQAENLQSYSRLFLVSLGGEISGPHRVDSRRLQGKTSIVGLESVTDRNEAEAVKGRGVLLEKSELPKMGENEYYYYQFSGLTVKTVEGRLLGKVENIFSNGAQDILVVRQEDQEYLIPVLQSVIARRTDEELIVDPPAGLLEINSEGSEDEDG